jgi:hypothetical protein
MLMVLASLVGLCWGFFVVSFVVLENPQHKPTKLARTININKLDLQKQQNKPTRPPRAPKINQLDVPESLRKNN